MAYNPFLSMNEPTAPATEDVLNPFMMVDIESSALTGDNPFVASNPFSDFGENYEPAVGDTVPVDIFGGESPTNLGAKNFENTPLDVFTGQQSDSEKFTKPTELDLVSTIVDSPSPTSETCSREPPTHSLPPETQNLILSVTGQMEFTSTHLLDRIPPTRTPSPVSVRDIHSPSPTPEPEFHEEGTTIENVEETKHKPARPPPARPPRPAPPSVAPSRPQAPPSPVPPRPEAPPSVAPPRPQALPSDDINLFDAPVPVLTKPTKEDILSLYSAPKKEEKQIDFLSGDILEDMHPDSGTEIHPSMITTMNTTSPLFQHDFVSNDNVMDDTIIPMDCSEPMDISQTNTSPPMEDIDEKLQELAEFEKNPFETDEQIDEDLPSFSNDVSDIFSSQPEDSFMASNIEVQENQNEAFVQIQPIEQCPKTEHKIFMEAEAGTMVNEDITFDTDKSDIVVNNTGVPSSSDFGWDTSETTVHESAQPSEDAFDAFSAKFESATPSHMQTGT